MAPVLSALGPPARRIVEFDGQRVESGLAPDNTMWSPLRLGALLRPASGRSL